MAFQLDQPPLPYQQIGAYWLAERSRALLGDEPGLGKTCQLVIGADLVCAETILVCVPAIGRYVWEREIKLWSLYGHEINVILTTEDRPRAGCVNIVSYDLLARGFAKTGYQHTAFLKRFIDIKWDLVIGDEAHRLKEANSLRTQAVLGNKGIGQSTRRLWLATGTPMPNGPWELWTLLVSLGATTLDYKPFIERYCELGTWGFSKGEPIGTKMSMADELNKLLKSVMMRRLKEFVLPELPKIRVDDFPIPPVKINLKDFFEDALINEALTMKRIKDQEAFVQAMWDRTISSDGRTTTVEMVRALEAMGESVSHYRRWLGAIKAASFLPIIDEELSTGAVKKVVIFAHHHQVIRFLAAKLKNYDPLVVDGHVSNKLFVVDKFQKEAKHRVFIGSIMSCQEVITLTAAHEVVVVEPDWVPSNNAQAIMRVHRIGQKMPVRARFVRIPDSLDDYISDVLAKKTREIVRVVDN